MAIERQVVPAEGVRFSVRQKGTEVARAFLYIMHNDLHERPFGLMEDVYVSEQVRGEGVGSELVAHLVEAARESNCYKLIATSRSSRPRVHALYERLGFANHGVEFRLNFN